MSTSIRNPSSKWELMYDFWYDYIKPKYQYHAKLCYMDTDVLSFISKLEMFMKTLQIMLKNYLIYQIMQSRDHFLQQKVKGPLHLTTFAIANIGQVLVQVLTQYLVQVFHFSGFSFCEKLFFHSSYAVLTCTRNGRNSFISDFNNH